MTNKCKTCNSNARKLNLPINLDFLPEHPECNRNHDGSYKSMESMACVLILIKVFDVFGVVVYGLVGDDDFYF